MKTVLLRAPLLTKSGYGVHSRQVARWLFEKSDQYKLDVSTELLSWGSTPWITDLKAEDGLVGEIVQATSNNKNYYDVTIQLVLPDEWNPNLGSYNIGITAGVETDICNPSWIDCINKMDLVIVPSEFTKQTFLTTAKNSNKKFSTPILVIPESFPDCMQTNTSKTLDLNLETEFNFLMFGQLTGNNPENDRKNLMYTMKWFLEVFHGNKNVGLVIKTNFGRLTKLDKAIVRNIFEKACNELNLDENSPKLYLLHGDMTDEEVSMLYQHPKIKALVTLTHGEGFGLPILEAAACGLPVIATDWSAHVEFLKHGKYVSVESTLQPLPASKLDKRIFVENAKWAYPKEVDAKMRMKKFLLQPTMPQTWAKELQKQIREKYSFYEIGKKYDAMFEEYVL